MKIPLTFDADYFRKIYETSWAHARVGPEQLKTNRMELEAWLAERQAIRVYELVAEGRGLTLIEDSEATFYPWSTFTKATVDRHVIQLREGAEMRLLLPATAMQDVEYRLLSMLILDKVKSETEKGG